MQHWKLRSDPALDRLDRLARKNGRRIDDSAAAISRKYLAYFSENDPTKRAVLMREFVPLALRDERENLAVRGNGTETGATAASGRRSGRGSPSDILRDSTKTPDEKTGRTIPPPPPVSRFSGGSSRGSTRQPNDVLDRSRSMPDYDRNATPKPSAAGRRDRDKPSSDSPDN